MCTRGLTHLHEDFAEDDVVVVFEHRAEHHRHSVFLGLQDTWGDRTRQVKRVKQTLSLQHISHSSHN